MYIGVLPAWMHVCTHVCKCTMCTPGAYGVPRTGATSSCELLYGYRQQNLDPLQQQQVLVITEHLSSSCGYLIFFLNTDVKTNIRKKTASLTDVAEKTEYVPVEKWNQVLSLTLHTTFMFHITSTIMLCKGRYFWEDCNNIGNNLKDWQMGYKKIKRRKKKKTQNA